MLTANKLEKIIELEDNLKAQYQVQLDAKATEIAGLIKDKEDQLAVIARQLETITDLSEKASVNQKLEQRNRELHNRSENLQEEIAGQKARLKTLQKDLAEAREEIKELKKFDSAKMKKNLDASKKKLAEKTSAADVLQKSLNQTRKEKAELEQKVSELEARLKELEPAEEAEEEAEAA
jgi:septal ring factor EnvC (AmiA/AmiB activator)